MRWVERYERGERIQVWTEMTAEGRTLRETPRWSEAVEVARATMRRVRANVELLAELLPAAGYQFTVPARAHTAPAADTAEQLDAIEAEMGQMPLALRCWYQEVGGVDFRGEHPTLELGIADPIFVEGSFEYAWSEYRAWMENLEQDRADAVYNWVISPDFLHKADISGGGDYTVMLGNRGVDGLLLMEHHQTTFVNYLRLCFARGGFPSWGRQGSTGEPLPIGPPPPILADLAGRLLPI